MSTEIPTAEYARSVLASQPFSRLLGAELVEFGRERAVVQLAIREDHLQQDGFVHGGVTAYLLDNCVTFAAGAILGPSVMTGGLTVDYLQPAEGVTLRAQAVVIRASRRSAVVRCNVEAIDHSGQVVLCAVGQGHVSRRRAESSRLHS